METFFVDIIRNVGASFHDNRPDVSLKPFQTICTEIFTNPKPFDAKQIKLHTEDQKLGILLVISMKENAREINIGLESKEPPQQRF